MMRLCIFKDATVRLPRNKIEGLFLLIMKEETNGNLHKTVNIIFTGNSRLKALNKTFRNRNKATDVLSFKIDEPDARENIFGEIYISVTTAQKQAREYKVSLNSELLRLVCHGLLHLLGYDHIKMSEKAMMQSRERYFLAGVNALQ